jgi:hypothetical protein
MNFDSAAKEIVANSIRSAICIDDEFVEPYEKTKGKVKDVNKPKQLMESFRKSNCSLDIYTYRSYLKLKKESDFIFKNRDLMILDWELSNNDPKFKYALNILKDAVENPGLAFVLIYTKKPDLAGIEMQIRYFFNQKILNEDERKEIYTELLSCLDDKFFFVEDSDGVPAQSETFFKDRKIKDAINEFVMGEPSDEAIKKFKARIREYFSNQKTGAKFLNLFEESVKELYRCNSLFEGCEQLEFHQVEFRDESTYISPESSSPTFYCHKIHGQEHALWISNTYITIFYKGELSPDSVYERFSTHLCNRPGNIMTLISLEMKNNFRENSGKIGKDLLAIDEHAFFHHRNNLPYQDEFYDFLRNIWKHQVASFHPDSDSQVFRVLDEYIDKNRIQEKLRKILKGDKIEKFCRELAMLNYQYSFHHTVRKKGDYIRFGDIFTIRESSKAIDSEGYLLNITGHCDCLRPKQKINYNFHFVTGEYAPFKSALEKVDDENSSYSFLFRNKEPVCISWETKPFTIFIPEDKRFFSANKPIKVQIGKESKYLFYEGTLLENYTQRIANKAFSHASRVGTDLAKLNISKESKK